MSRYRIYQRFANNGVVVTISAEGFPAEERAEAFRVFATAARHNGFIGLHEPRQKVSEQ